jgi:glycosyltransferase involved in cell wall biosynthesis
MPAYGVSNMLGDALDSLQAQDREDWEAIVIDDGDPRVAEAIQPYAHDARIRLVQTENGGLPTARNRAIALARAPLISLLDGDDIYQPGYMSAMIAAVEASPTIGFACCDAIYFGHDRDGDRFSAHCPQVLPITLERVLRRQFNVFICTTIRRAAIDAIGGFDAGLKSAEDLDLWLRLLEAGWDLAYVPKPLARYRRRAGQMSSNSIVMNQSEMMVYENARQRLEGRPEQAVAIEMYARTAKMLEAELGIGRVRAGATGEGVNMLRAAEVHKRSLRWRIAMLLIRIMPPLAGPLIRLRDKI